MKKNAPEIDEISRKKICFILNLWALDNSEREKFSYVTQQIWSGSSFCQRKVSTPILNYRSNECCYIPMDEVHPTESLVLLQPILILSDRIYTKLQELT
jgi:hypothetical protein